MSHWALVPIVWLAVSAATVPAEGPAEQPVSGDSVVRPDAPLRVRLASGRRLEGVLDARTNARALWIRVDLTAGFLLRPVQWDRVTAVDVAGHPLAAGQLRQFVSQWTFSASAADRGTDREVGDRSRSVSEAHLSAPGPETVGSPSRRSVRWVEMEARAGNWDRDSGADGLVVELVPRDAGGRPVAARGVAELYLLVEEQNAVRPSLSIRRRPRWVRRVEMGDFADGRLTLRLPFRSFDPEFDPRWSPYGAVHLRFHVPGQGTFEAYDGMVRLRPFSPLRDHYQQQTGRRRFPWEHTVRHGGL